MTSSDLPTIYIVGPLTPKGNRKDTGNAAIEYLYNVRDFIEAAKALIAKGWAPYCPGIDFSYFMSPGPVITEAQIKGISMAWLVRSDAVLTLPGWEKSSGSLAEIETARLLNINLYHALGDVPDGKYFVPWSERRKYGRQV